MQIEIELFGVSFLRFFIGNPFGFAEAEEHVINTAGDFSIPFGFSSDTTNNEEE